MHGRDTVERSLQHAFVRRPTLDAMLWSERRIAAKNACDGGATLVDNHLVVK